MSSPTSLVEDQRPMTGSEKEPQTGKKKKQRSHFYKLPWRITQEVGYSWLSHEVTKFMCVTRQVLALRTVDVWLCQQQENWLVRFKHDRLKTSSPLPKYCFRGRLFPKVFQWALSQKTNMLSCEVCKNALLAKLYQEINFIDITLQLTLFYLQYLQDTIVRVANLVLWENRYVRPYVRPWGIPRKELPFQLDTECMTWILNFGQFRFSGNRWQRYL